MSTKTRDKLNEAKFFLKYMFETQCSPSAKTQSGQDAFRYFLNAFLSAFRSITRLPAQRDIHLKNYRRDDYVLEKEFGHVDGFNDWYQEKHEALKNDKVFWFLKEQRNRVIHFTDNKSVEIRGRTTANFADFLRIISAIDPTNPKIELIGPQQEPYEIAFLFGEMKGNICPTNEVIPVCSVYLQVIEKIVDECESTFSLQEEVATLVP